MKLIFFYFLIISIISKMINNSSVISPLPKITVQKRVEKVNLKITQMIKKLGKRREMQILQERSQGFWMEDQVKISLDRIKLRTHRMKTMPYSLKTLEFQHQMEKKRHKTMQKNNLNKKRLQNKFYLPELKQMILNRQNESSKLIIAKRRKIIHLLILGLNRRNLGKLYEALDIVLLASFYFEKDDQQRQLKSICLSLISKLHRQIKTQKLSLNRKSKLNKKRKSLTVINYLTRQNFMENFIMKLRKTKLVGQFSYSDNKKHQNNVKKINAKCEVVVPHPEQIFDPALGVTNYDYVAITVDDHTNSFPYQYPKSLSEKIDVIQWRQMICKLNGLLFPESKCYSFSSIVKLFYLPFTLIFILMLTFSIFRTFISSQIGRLVLICSTIFLVLLLAIKVNIEESGYTNYIEIKDKMKAYLAEWEDKFSDLNLKFRMGQNIDAIFIAFPSEDPDSSQSSSKLTQIQQVDENNTQNHTQSKGQRETYSIKGMRRTGGRFEENGNIMKKKTFSKFANSEQKSLKRQNTMKSSCKNQQLQENVQIKVKSQKKIQPQVQKQQQNQVYEGFMYTSQIKNKPFREFKINKSFFNQKKQNLNDCKQTTFLQEEKQKTFVYKPDTRQSDLNKSQQNKKFLFALSQITQRSKQGFQGKLPIKGKANFLKMQAKIASANFQDKEKLANGKYGSSNQQQSATCKKSIDQNDCSQSYLITPQSRQQNL